MFNAHALSPARPNVLSTMSRLGAAALLTAAACIQGCSGFGSKPSDGSLVFDDGEFSSDRSRTSIFLDGDIAEWPSSTVAWADKHHLYLRFSVENEQFTLQSAPVSVTLLLDTDASAATGTVVQDKEPFSAIGADMEIQFSPKRDTGAAGRGVALSALDNAGRALPMTTHDWDFSCAPTFASSWYEARISRLPTGQVPLPKDGLLTKGKLRGIVALMDENHNVLGYSDPFEVSMPEASPTPRFATVYTPRKPDKGVRVMTYNVLRGSPNKEPRSFKSLLQAIDPDVVLVQEWECQSPGEVEQWFRTMLPGKNWKAQMVTGSTQDGGGVGVVTWLPMEALLPKELIAQGAGAESTGRRVRFMAAAIDTPAGILLAGSTHLKCCGTKDSAEDRTRMAEARVINGAMELAGKKYPEAMRVIGGDFNLVGSRPPLDLIRAGLDNDGSDLEVSKPLALGDRSMITWSEPGNEFAPGRLDYVLYSGVSAAVSHAFVFDTSRLSEAALIRMSLQRQDSRGSDHMPVVIDFTAAK